MPESHTPADAGPTPRTDALIERFRAEKYFDVDDALDLCRKLEGEGQAFGSAIAEVAIAAGILREDAKEGLTGPQLILLLQDLHGLAAKACIASESASRTWIAVGERLPEARYGTGVGHPAIISDDVLVYLPGVETVMLANYDHEEKFWTSSEGGVWAGVEPTHWMPVPEAPNGK